MKQSHMAKYSLYNTLGNDSHSDPVYMKITPNALHFNLAV